LKEQLDSANEVLAGYKEKEEEMAKKEKALKRRASLVEAGLDDEAAEAAVAKFENLDDESFDSVALVITEAAKTAEAKMPPALKEALDKKKDKEEDKEDATKKKPKASEEIVAEETEETEAAEEEADEVIAEASDLETVETDEEVSLSVAGEEEVSAVETTRAALVDFVKSRLQTK
jgi:hypothetical protein